MKGHSLAPRFPHPRLLPSQVLLSAASGAGAVSKDRFRVMPAVVAARTRQLQGEGTDAAGGVGSGRHGRRHCHIVGAYRQG